MKRCPECHFTFEDRVQVCDFDGSELTSFADPAPLSDRIVEPSTKSNLIRFANSRIGLAVLVLLLLVPGVVLIVRHKSSSPPNSDEKASIAVGFTSGCRTYDGILALRCPSLLI